MKKILIVLMVMVLLFAIAGCSQAERVGHNISKEADLFNVTRRISVLNMRSDKPIFELVGTFSIKNNANNELEVIVQTGEETFTKHFIYLNEWTMYVVEDLSGANVSKYHYEIHYIPEMIIPFTVK